MNDFDSTPDADQEAESSASQPARKRPAKGERRIEILQAFAAMLQEPGGEKVTTAALAKRLSVSEAALYRHFASKAQMLEGLIDFIEDSVLALMRQAQEKEADPQAQCARMMQVVLQFGQVNPGMVRIMVGDALLHEHERLGVRMQLFNDKIESMLRASWRAHAERLGHAAPTADAKAHGEVMANVLQGRLLRFARSGWRAQPVDGLNEALGIMLA